MGELTLTGLVALIFALGSYYTSETFGVFGWVNLVGGSAALIASAVLAARRQGSLGSAAGRRLLLPRIAWVFVAVAVSVAAERTANHSGFQLDFTAEGRYSLSPATAEALAALEGTVTATLYRDAFDPRARSTRMLLSTLALAGDVEVRERVIDEVPAEADRYEVGSSNTVVLINGSSFETVERPTEGAIFEALQRLREDDARIAYLARGEGEGNLGRFDDTGFSGLAHALGTEGFTVREWVSAAATEIPDDASLVMFVGPQRGLREQALEAVESYLLRGGGLIALLDPGVETGLEELLTRWGFGFPEGVVVDPASGPVEGAPAGVNPIVYQYSKHPITRGLDSARMTFFVRARAVNAARKPEPDDEMRALAYTSRRAWLAPNVAEVERGVPPRRPEGPEGPDGPEDASEDYWPIVSAGRYPRETGEVRIVVFGDSTFASNRYLRALYNLDLIMNAVHWVTGREDIITLRPKALPPHQFPLTPQQSLQMLYGVGLLIPELSLIVAAVIWVRRRSA